MVVWYYMFWLDWSTMDTTVTARISVELKEQVVPILHEMGETTSSLIASAFTYVLATHEMPKAAPDKLCNRKLTSSEIEELHQRAQAMILPEKPGRKQSRKEA